MIQNPRCSSFYFIRRAAVILVAALGFSGCATSEYRYTKTIAGGERITFRMEKGQVDDAKADGFQARPPIVLPNPEQKKIRYVFGLVVESATAPKHVRVEDVSDEQAILLLEDAEPQLKDGMWARETPLYGVDSPEINWVTYLGESFRVYRITVVAADGRTVILHEGHLVPAFFKAAMRHLLGKDY